VQCYRGDWRRHDNIAWLARVNRLQAHRVELQTATDDRRQRTKQYSPSPYTVCRRDSKNKIPVYNISHYRHKITRAKCIWLGHQKLN